MTAHLPKAELHVHLEATASPELVRRNAERYGVDVSRLFDAEGRYRWTDFSTFIASYDVAASVFRSAEDFAELVEGYLVGQSQVGCLYTEFFISPDFARRNGLPYADYLGGVAEGIRRAEARTGIVGRIIPLIERHFGPADAIGAAKVAVDNLIPEVVGFGMAGDERVFEPWDFVPAFMIAHEAGLPLTCHAGEWQGWDHVEDTLNALPLKRIGHGVRSIENADFVRRLVDEGVHLEICPGSNIALGAFTDFASHPLRTFFDAGVRLSLNSDDPPFFWSSIDREYAIAAEHFGFTDAELLRVTRMAIEDAFCDAATKAKLLARL
ncbi:adenosine deaminase [Oryzibacter oryziterrae]|uniref:adenosine deaminase n=1 Tax=Oryzibacter oryziterrae TaxID=2766474 RepID=UPI001EFFF57A|nr:adenosine deaminase [Oryzibacter oryziterrae]